MKRINRFGIVLLCGLMLTACGNIENTVATDGNSFSESLGWETATRMGVEIIADSAGLLAEQAPSEQESETSERPEQELEQPTEPEPIPEPVITTVTISAVGDVTLGTNQKHSYSKSFHEYYDKYGKEYFLQKVKGVFEADDFTIINCEGTFTESDKRMDKLWNHKGKPEYVEILTCASVEAVTLGNNHIMDYGEVGVADTIQTVTDAGLEYALSGPWGNHYGMYEAKGVKIGFVSVNEHYDELECYPWLEDGLKTLREEGADIVIACTHWGDDYFHEIGQEQYDMGRWCIDQGYDLVLGCHPHLLQGIELYKDKYIVYSMGNFCYGGNKNPAEKDSMIFQQTFTFVDGKLQTDTDAIRVIPCRLSSSTNRNDYCPMICEGEMAEETIANLNSYCEEFGIKFGVDGYLVKEEAEEPTQDSAQE